MSQYAPPPANLPSNDHYAPPPGPPPANVEYAPPPGPPPAGPPLDRAVDPFVDVSPSEPPPAYSKNPTATDTRVSDPSNPSVEFITLSIPPAGAVADGSYWPLDPPPECFSTPSPLRVRSRSFAPFRIPSIDASILHGFRPLYPPALLQPHGISAEDWGAFLRGLGVAARLAQRGISAVAPNRGTVKPRGPLIGMLAGPRGTAGGPYDQAFVKSPAEEVQALIEVWNGSAFERRKLRVSLRSRAEEGGGRQGWDLLVEAL